MTPEKIRSELADIEHLLNAIVNLAEPCSAETFGYTLGGVLGCNDQRDLQAEGEKAFFWMEHNYDSVSGVIYAINTLANIARGQLDSLYMQLYSEASRG